DRAVALSDRAARPRVSLVSPGTPYLEAALSVLPVRRVDRTGEVDPASWGGYDLVVLDRVPATTLPPGRHLIVIRFEEAFTLLLRGGTVLAEGTVPLLWVLERPELRAVLLPFDLLRSDLPMHPTFPLLSANALDGLGAVGARDA